RSPTTSNPCAVYRPTAGPLSVRTSSTTGAPSASATARSLANNPRPIPRPCAAGSTAIVWTSNSRSPAGPSAARTAYPTSSPPARAARQVVWREPIPARNGGAGRGPAAATRTRSRSARRIAARGTGGPAQVPRFQRRRGAPSEEVVGRHRDEPGGVGRGRLTEPCRRRRVQLVEACGVPGHVADTVHGDLRGGPHRGAGRARAVRGVPGVVGLAAPRVGDDDEVSGRPLGPHPRGEGVERAHPVRRYPEGVGERRGGGHPHPQSGERSRPGPHRHRVEI